MIPPFKLYFYPFLLCLSNGNEEKLITIAQFIANYYEISGKDLKEKTKAGSTSKHKSRVNFCATYLKRLGYVKSRPIGMYTITEKGLIVLEEKGDKLTRDDLRILPEYIDMQINKSNPEMVYVKEHFNKKGKYVPSYWCNINALSKTSKIQAIKDTEEKNREDANT